MRTRAKLGLEVAASAAWNLNNVSASAEARGFQLETLWFNKNHAYVNRVVKFLGSDLESIAHQLSLPGASVQFFGRYYGDSLMWDEISIDEADYYSMALINGTHWAFAPCVFEFTPHSGSSILDFEDMEEIETKLLARAS